MLRNHLDGRDKPNLPGNETSNLQVNVIRGKIIHLIITKSLAWIELERGHSIALEGGMICTIR
jgi:molybdopterin-binding protein